MESFPIPAPAFNGNSRVVPPGNAFDWLQQGWALFAANPGLWIGLTIVLLVIVLGVQIVPLVGTLAAHLLMPVLGAGMLLVCRKIDEEERVQIDDREERVVRVLQIAPLHECPDVVADLEGVGRGLHTRVEARFVHPPSLRARHSAKSRRGCALTPRQGATHTLRAATHTPRA